MTYSYKTNGTCSREIIIDVDGDIIQDVKFIGGCNGFGKGVSAIVRGMSIDHVIERFKNIKCGQKETSCPDQLAKALSEVRNMTSSLV